EGVVKAAKAGGAAGGASRSKGAAAAAHTAAEEATHQAAVDAADKAAGEAAGKAPAVGGTAPAVGDMAALNDLAKAAEGAGWRKVKMGTVGSGKLEKLEKAITDAQAKLAGKKLAFTKELARRQTQLQEEFLRSMEDVHTGLALVAGGAGAASDSAAVVGPAQDSTQGKILAAQQSFLQSVQDQEMAAQELVPPSGGEAKQDPIVAAVMNKVRQSALFQHPPQPSKTKAAAAPHDRASEQATLQAILQVLPVPGLTIKFDQCAIQVALDNQFTEMALAALDNQFTEMASDGPRPTTPGRYSAMSKAVGRAVRDNAESDVDGAKPALKRKVVQGLRMVSSSAGPSAEAAGGKGKGKGQVEGLATFKQLSVRTPARLPSAMSRVGFVPGQGVVQGIATFKQLSVRRRPPAMTRKVYLRMPSIS
ncbi:hypothetical protein T484DRAFT_1760850, partial [Baffinella frigidus]